MGEGRSTQALTLSRTQQAIPKMRIHHLTTGDPWRPLEHKLSISRYGRSFFDPVRASMCCLLYLNTALNANGSPVFGRGHQADLAPHLSNNSSLSPLEHGFCHREAADMVLNGCHVPCIAFNLPWIQRDSQTSPIRLPSPVNVSHSDSSPVRPT